MCLRRSCRCSGRRPSIPSATIPTKHRPPSRFFRYEISKLHAHVGAEVCVRGWLSNERSSGGMLFLELRDGSGFCRAAVEKSSVGEECWDNAQRLTRESSCYVRGIVRADKRAPTGIELTVSDLKLFSWQRIIPSDEKSMDLSSIQPPPLARQVKASVGHPADQG